MCGAVVRGASAAAQIGVALFDRSERAIGRAGQPDRRVLTLPSLADLPPALAGGMAVQMVVDVMSGWRRAWDESRCARLLERERAAFAHAPKSAVVLAIGVAWLTATVVHALLATFDYEPASWMAWGVSTAIGLALVSGRTSIADAWTAIAERREVPVENTALTRVRMLVVTPFPEEGAGYRFRIWQYLAQASGLRRVGEPVFYARVLQHCVSTWQLPAQARVPLRADAEAPRPAARAPLVRSHLHLPGGLSGRTAAD